MVFCTKDSKFCHVRNYLHFHAQVFKPHAYRYVVSLKSYNNELIAILCRFNPKKVQSTFCSLHTKKFRVYAIASILTLKSCTYPKQGLYKLFDC